MKKSKILFVFVTAALSLGSLIGCNDIPGSSSQSNSDVPSNSAASGDTSRPSDTSANPSSDSSASSSASQNSTSNPSSSSAHSSNPSSSAPSSSNPSSSSSSGGSSASGSSGSSGSQGGDSDIYTWSDADLALFSDHLHGCVLPHPGKEGVRVTVYPTMPNYVIVEGCQFVDNELANYAAKYSISDGWKGGDISQTFSASAPIGSIYQFSKNVNTADGLRGVVVLFTCMQYENDGGFHYSTSGELRLQATDPYSYSYSDLLNELLNEVDISADDLPPELSGVTAYSYTVSQDGSVTVFMYIDSATAERDFTSLLTTNGWTIVVGGDVTPTRIAYSPNDALQMTYYYDSTNKCLILVASQYGRWNAQKIKQFFAKYNQTAMDIPALDIAGAKYKFKEDTNNATYAEAGRYDMVSATMEVTDNSINAKVFSDYIESTKNAGWVTSNFDPENNSWYRIIKVIGDDKVYDFDVSLEKTTITIKFYADGRSYGDNRLAAYPSDQIAEFIGGLQDSLPYVAVRNSGYLFQTRGELARLAIFTDPDGAEKAMSSYKTMLTRMRFTQKEGSANAYVSGHNELEVSLSLDNGVLEQLVIIDIKKIDNTPVVTPWPSARIAEAIVSNLNGAEFQDAIPTVNVESAEDCSVNSNLSGCFEIYIDGYAANLAAVKQVFVDNGWKADVFSYDPEALVSPHQEMTAKFSVDGDDITIRVDKYIALSYADWPAETISGYLAEWDVQDNLPAFDKASMITPMGISEGTAQKEFKIYVYTYSFTKVAANAAKQRFEDSLKMAQYQMNGDLKGFVSAHEELLVKVSVEQAGSSDGADGQEYFFLCIYVNCLKEDPIPDPVYKIVGTMNDWSYEDSEILLVDAPDPDYKSQLKAEFDVEAEDEFKVKDDSGEKTGWYGFEILERNEYFTNQGGNIKATQAGSVVLYFKLYEDGGRSIAIEFTPAPVPAVWPGDEVGTWLITHNLEDDLPEMSNDNVASFDFIYDESKPNQFSVQANAKEGKNGRELRSEYVELLLSDEVYALHLNEAGKEVYSTENHDIEVSLDFTANALLINVVLFEKPVQPELVEWPEEELDAIVVDAWGVENIIPKLENEIITDIQIQGYNGEEDSDFRIVLAGGGSLLEEYEMLLEEAFHDGGYDIWVANTATMQISVSAPGDGRDLYIDVAFRGQWDRWPEDQLTSFFDNGVDFFPYSAKTEAKYTIEFSSDELEEKYAVVFVNVGEDGAADAMNDAIIGILREFGAEFDSPAAYVYDEETGILSSPSAEYPTYQFELIDDKYFSVKVYFEVAPVQDNGYADAIYSIYEYLELDEETVLPDFEMEDAIAYEVESDNTISISFAEDADLGEKLDEVISIFTDNGYHYTRSLCGYINVETNVYIDAYIDDGKVFVRFEQLDFSEDDDNGYSMVFIEFDEANDYYYFNGGVGSTYDSEWYDDYGNKVTQYTLMGVSLEEGQLISFYNYVQEEEFYVRIDEYSFGGNIDEFLEWNEEAQAYVVKQSFTANFYLKLQYGNDCVYIGLVPAE